MTEVKNRSVAFSLFLILLLLGLAAVLSFAVLSLPSEAPGLTASVSDNLDESGVSNPVTAVLLNFRGYDTLLEMSVLLLALIAVWSLGDRIENQESAPGAVLDLLSRLLIPLFVLVAGYLLWVGANAPGGAFQAGSVLASACVLVLLTNWQPGVWYMGLALRITLIFGLFVFVIVAVVVQFAGQRMLEFPVSIAGALVLLIEAAATLSIGAILAALFWGSPPPSYQSKGSRVGSMEKK